MSDRKEDQKENLFPQEMQDRALEVNKFLETAFQVVGYGLRERFGIDTMALGIAYVADDKSTISDVFFMSMIDDEEIRNEFDKRCNLTLAKHAALAGGSDFELPDSVAAMKMDEHGQNGRFV